MTVCGMPKSGQICTYHFSFRGLTPPTPV